MKKKIVAGLITIVAIVAVVMFMGCVEKPPSAPTETPTLTPSPKAELSLGESAILDDIEFTVVRFEESHEYEYGISNETVYPAEGAKFLWVYVIAKNVGEVARKVPMSSSIGFISDIEMLYKGEKIFTHNMGGSASSLKREIYDPGRSPLYPDVTDEGWILFEVPEGIDLSQAKIRVDSPTNYTKTVTWSF